MNRVLRVEWESATSNRKSKIGDFRVEKISVEGRCIFAAERWDNHRGAVWEAGDFVEGGEHGREPSGGVGKAAAEIGRNGAAIKP
jgi:hypothetical protein